MNEARPGIDQLIAQGIAAQNAQRFGDAERAYRAALQIDSAHPQALALLGTLAGIAGRFPMAIDLFLRALQRDPKNPDLYHNLGETYRQTGEIGKALPAFNRALELRPDHLESYRSAADTAIAAADAAQAAGRSDHARELRRLAAQYLAKLGQKRYRQRLGGVEETFREADRLDPDNPDILYMLGTVLQVSALPTESVAMLRRAIARGAKDGETYVSLGNALSALGLWAEMEEAYRAAIAVDPGFKLGQEGLDSTTLMRPLYEDKATPAEIFEQHRAWGERARSGLGAAAEAPPFANKRDPERRLRIAYISGDFKRHPVAVFLRPLLAYHNPAAVSVFCYSELDHPDETTNALRRMRVHWRDTYDMSDEALRAQLRADGIDIAIDLAGHTAKNRLRALAVKAAPVVATWLGYPATTGLSTIDWRITDAIADPPGAERFYTERLMRLPDGFLCYEPPLAEAPAVAPSPAALTMRFTFGSFNNPAKLSPSTLEAWASILAALPEARLVLKATTLADPAIRAGFLERFAARGIDAGRVELRTAVTKFSDHFASYGAMDIALDPFPYNGTTTSCDALWMGVPVVTLIGERHTGRVGLDLLTRIGLAELAAPSVDAYVATAVSLARDLPRLQSLRQSLRERMRASVLCDAAGFTRRFEAGLREMWREWCAKGA